MGNLGRPDGSDEAMNRLGENDQSVDDTAIRRSPGQLVFHRMLAPVPGEFILTRDKLVFERRTFPFPHSWVFEPRRRDFPLSEVASIQMGSVFDKVGYFGWASPLRIQMKNGRSILVRIDDANSWEADISRLTGATNDLV